MVQLLGSCYHAWWLSLKICYCWRSFEILVKFFFSILGTLVFGHISATSRATEHCHPKIWGSRQRPVHWSSQKWPQLTLGRSTGYCLSYLSNQLSCSLSRMVQLLRSCYHAWWLSLKIFHCWRSFEILVKFFPFWGPLLYLAIFQQPVELQNTATTKFGVADGALSNGKFKVDLSSH